ncbi:protein kinase C substrate 80 like protein [Tieghemostelium lacteum]|uniref:Glucosidase 2 subunit beta n=1 Tax=Tieghemostelium lacteum TaxID=361077 RepID=A0A152A2L9_TIELA|nr:protein kinase C substrate 80 like protein [Tieghemostelium lacteum]|eukprot:KYR00450.1 protein kinase C substrate 80 like protein [Tieghemostelium lacteum]
MKIICILLVLVSILSICVYSKANKYELSPTFGVSPELLEYYQGKTFSCLRSNKQIPIEQVNDDYCDCPDGTDEPGTSACNNGVFYCANKGYKPSNLHTSLLNDGFCDCCDGSDEYLGKVTCPNNCQDLGSELRKKREQEIETYTAGLKKKSEMEEESKSIWASKQEELERLKKEIDPLNSDLKELQTKKDNKQKEKDAERQALKEKRQQELKELEEQQEPKPLDGEGQEINTDELKESKEGSEDVQPEVPTVEEKPLTSENLETISRGKDQNDDHNDDNNDEKHGDSFLYMLVQNHFSTLWNFFKQYLPKSVYSDLNDLESLESEISSKKDTLREKENAISDIEKLFTYDFGKNNVYLPLHGKCFEVKTKEYSYSFCPYDKAQQGHTSLGKFEKWEGSVMEFANGQQCWGGPKRSLKVSFECGVDNEAYDVQEPSKCEYSMKFKTAAACDSEHLKILSLDKDHQL